MVRDNEAVDDALSRGDWKGAMDAAFGAGNWGLDKEAKDAGGEGRSYEQSYKKARQMGGGDVTKQGFTVTPTGSFLMPGGGSAMVPGSTRQLNLAAQRKLFGTELLGKVADPRATDVTSRGNPLYGAYRSSQQRRESVVRDRFKQEISPGLKRDFRRQFEETRVSQGVAPAITELLGNLEDLKQGDVGALEDSGFDVGRMRELQGKGFLGSVAQSLGFDIDDYENPETALSELQEIGAVEYDEETGEYKPTSKLLTMTGGGLLSLLTMTPGVGVGIYSATGSPMLAALGQQATSEQADRMMETGQPSTQESLVGSGLSQGVSYFAPQISPAVDAGTGPGQGLLAALDVASKMQAAGIYPSSQEYISPAGESGVRNRMAIPFSNIRQARDRSSGFSVNPYTGNLAAYYKMFTPQFG